MTTDTARFSSSPFSRVVLISVSQCHINDRHGSRAVKKVKKYYLKFKRSFVKFAGENSGEAAARRFSVDQKRVRETEPQRLSEEDSNRTRLPAGGRKKASEEPEINMRGFVISKRARHERVSRKMIRVMEKQMSATVSDSRDEEFAASSGWLNHFLHRNNFTCRRYITFCPE